MLEASSKSLVIAHARGRERVVYQKPTRQHDKCHQEQKQDAREAQYSFHMFFHHNSMR